MTIADNPMQLSESEMREIAHRVADVVVDRFVAMQKGEGPAVRVGRGDELRAQLASPIPEDGKPFDDVLSRALDDVLPYGVRLAHPRFFGFIPSPGNFISTMADTIVAGFNPFVGTWLGGSGPSQLELITIEWLCEICGLGKEAGGLFVSGGSQANLTCLAVARHERAASPFAANVVYCSDETHYCNTRALSVLGFDESQVRNVPGDASYRMDARALARMIEDDHASGRNPMCVVATAGTTNVGAVDPLDAIADICEESGAWFHIDGAYGASAVIAPAARQLLAGMERADSLSLDPHKWLFQPFESGCALVRQRDALRATFQVMPDYLQDVHRLGEVNFADQGVQLTRSFRALKLWMSLEFFGLDAFRQAIEHGMSLAATAERELASRPQWQVVTPAQLGIVSFRFADATVEESTLDAINDRFVGEIIADGYAMLSSTVLDGRTALRFCTINPATTRDDIVSTIDWLERLADRIRETL